jgi:hypothetical protein
MLKWSSSCDNADSAFNNSELKGDGTVRKNGRYPFGEYGAFHSGIHFTEAGEREICPVIGGKVVAYRISKQDKEIDRLKEINNAFFSKLIPTEQGLYETTQETKDLEEKDKKYALKDPSKLSEEIRKQYYKERRANNFILMKHSIVLKHENDSAEGKEVEFFSLYSCFSTLQLTGDYGPIDSVKRNLPFYNGYLFRVKNKEADLHEYAYTTIYGVELYPYSKCRFRKTYTNDLSWACNFTNFNDKNKTINVSKSEIVIISRRENSDEVVYMPKHNNVEIYDKDLKKLNVKLSMSAKFTKIRDGYQGKNETYLRVKVDQNEVWGESEGSIKNGTDICVKVDDLELCEGVGYLKENNSLCRQTKRGVMVYDTDEMRDGKPCGNARTVLATGTEFRPVFPYDILNAPASQTFVKLIKIGDEASDKFLDLRHIRLSGRNKWDIEVKVEWNPDITFEKAAVPMTVSPETSLSLDSDDIMGYSARITGECGYHYDFAILMNSVDFMEDASYKAYERSDDIKENNLLDWKKYFNRLEEDKTANAFFMVSEPVRKAILGNEYKEPVFVYDANSLTNRVIGKEESVGERQEKRKIVCKYPLEFDKTLYLDGDTVRGIVRNKYDAGVKGDDVERHFKDIVHALDIWGEIEPLKIPKFERNSFWFAHPVYFINHLDKTGLLERNAHVGELKRVQNKIVKELECLKKGGKGMYHIGSKDDTYCNHATFLTIEALDINYKQFIGYPNLYDEKAEPPWNIKEKLKGDFRRKHKEYVHKNSNIWCDILEEQANNFASGICRISPEEAQEKANLGYVVIAAWKNLKKSWEELNQPHYATVSPKNVQYDFGDGPSLANVGKDNGFYNTSKIFDKNMFDEVKWYYNRNQIFQENYKGIKDRGLK